MQINQSQFSLPGGRIPSGGIEGRREGEGFGSGGEGRVPSPDLKPKSASHSPGVEPQNSPSPIPVPELRGRKGQAWGVWAQGVHGTQRHRNGQPALGCWAGAVGWRAGKEGGEPPVKRRRGHGRVLHGPSAVLWEQDRQEVRTSGV